MTEKYEEFLPSRDVKRQLTKAGLGDMVKTIKSKIINEKLYGTEINEVVKNLSSTKALYVAVYPMIEKFGRNSIQD